MTICPIAVVAGCAKCPAFKVCPLKGVLGDQGDNKGKTEVQSPPPAPTPSKSRKKT
ncbi:hypothetical protein [Inhella gelatinilytica]|uniref:Uncharacterized protein n=1 Tax=Inhella gelatinilytica TaxID=2795030 RepID=A0A931ND75_9BURK|nr:hypothetical protein [Inhella gelatinilytica]MBH9551945.1 hypothetical protein [Inhella gelatinilytica]